MELMGNVFIKVEDLSGGKLRFILTCESNN